MVTAAEVEWLTGPSAVPWLSLAAQRTGGPLSLVTRLRKELSAEQARLVVEQAELRRRATEKFTQAERMFFTARGLEQATDEAVARYKARRFPAGEQIADLCCGIGGDLMALAERGPLTGVEREPTTAVLARANLRLAFPQSEHYRVVVDDVRDFHVGDFAAWHIDPDRRPAGKRTTRVALHEPGPDRIARLLGECPNAAVKLAPAADVPTDSDGINPGRLPVDWEQAELEWISRKRQCRQLVAWNGSLAEHPSRRRATRLSNNLSAHWPELVVASFVGAPQIQAPVARAIGRFVFEPDAAVLAAHLAGALAAELQLQSVGHGVAYFTADKSQNSPLLDGFEVLDVMPYQVKVLRAWLCVRHIGRLEVKKRGVELDPARVQRELLVPGEERATLLLCRIQGKITAILARRIV